MFLEDWLTKLDRWQLKRMQEKEERESKLSPLRIQRIEQEVRYTDLKTKQREVQSKLT